jgi:hypothetical protein
MTVKSKGQGSTCFGPQSRQGPLVFLGEFSYHIDTGTHRSEYEAQNITATVISFITYVHKYMHTYIPWIRLSQRQQDMEKIINTQIYKFTV